TPRGTRLQAISLLSGGEKALTGLALLFAIFYYRPSPFCLLDEVDAPLDDANIHRVTRVLRELSTQTQFIVITHNRKTMEAADVLYGVTMEEPGLSRIVSVNLGSPRGPGAGSGRRRRSAAPGWDLPCGRSSESRPPAASGSRRSSKADHSAGVAGGRGRRPAGRAGTH